VNSVASFANRMVEQIMQVTLEYEERLRRCVDVPRFSFGCRMLKNDSDPKRFFLMYLFCEQSLAITWRSVKAFLGQYNHGEDYEFNVQYSSSLG